MTQIFTVSELNERIRSRLDGDPMLHDMWARGELTGVKNHFSGHRYFTLKDSASEIRCVLFRGNALGLGFELKDGQNVLVYGDVDMYRARGAVQINARAVRLDSGIGERAREYEQIKQKLSAEGLFAAERKRPMPKIPSRIGVVTSPDGAALRDVLRIIGSFPAKVILSPALVQGDGAADSVARALKALRGLADVVIVCRGGGSAEDLWPFNQEAVARAIYECDVPVVSAIGHETDITIADFVADMRAPTPTAAARMVVPDPEALLHHLLDLERRMKRATEVSIDRQRGRLDYIERSLQGHRMYSLVSDHRQRLDYFSERLVYSEGLTIESLRTRLEMATGRLESVSPLATLRRGYAIARSSDGGLIIRAADVLIGDKVELVYGDGVLECRVEGRRGGIFGRE